MRALGSLAQDHVSCLARLLVGQYAAVAAVAGLLLYLHGSRFDSIVCFLYVSMCGFVCVLMYCVVRSCSAQTQTPKHTRRPLPDPKPSSPPKIGAIHSCLTSSMVLQLSFSGHNAMASCRGGLWVSFAGGKRLLSVLSPVARYMNRNLSMHYTDGRSLAFQLTTFRFVCIHVFLSGAPYLMILLLYIFFL